MPIFDAETLERLSRETPRTAYDEVKTALYRSGPVSSDDFQSAFEELVDSGLLTWQQIEEFEES